MPRKGENIYKRKDGRWEGRILVGYNDLGKAVYRSVYAHTYRDVRDKMKTAPPAVSRSSTDVTVYGFIDYLVKKLIIYTLNIADVAPQLVNVYLINSGFDTHINSHLNILLQFMCLRDD